MQDSFWIGSSYLLSSTISQPLITYLSSMFRRAPLLHFSVIMFAAGALTSALAQTMHTMLLGRVFQGTGAGGILVLSAILLTDLVPLRQRGPYSGMLSMMWAIGTVVGPIVGATATERSSWVSISAVSSVHMEQLTFLIALDLLAELALLWRGTAIDLIQLETGGPDRTYVTKDSQL